jgi:energy-coupling factor transporter transmembrane protein EcfT
VAKGTAGAAFRFHPLVKGAALLSALLVFGCFASGHPGKTAASLIPVLGACLFGSRSRGVSPWLIAEKLRGIWVLLLVIIVFSGLSTGGREPGLILANVLAVIGIMLAALGYAILTPQSEMTVFFTTLFLPMRPFGGRDRRWALAMTVGLRFLPELTRELERLRLAQRARGIPLSGGFTAWKDSLSLVVPAVVSAVRRAQTLAMAMELRGFHIDRPPTRFRHPSPGLPDFFAGAGLLLWIWWAGWG